MLRHNIILVTFLVTVIIIVTIIIVTIIIVNSRQNKMGVIFYNCAYQVATTTSFGNQDEWWLDNDHEGFRLDPDEIRDCTLSEFVHNILPLMKEDPKFIAVGIAGITTSQKKTLHLNLVKHAKIYRDQNRKPTDEEIAAAEAERAARDALLAQLQLETVTLRDSLQDAEAKLNANQKIVDRFEGKYQKYKEQAKEKKVEIKEKKVEISDLKGQVTALQKKVGEPDVTVEVELLALNKIVGKNNPEVALDYLDKRRGTTRQYHLNDKKLGMFDSTAGTTIKAIAADQEGNPNGKAQALLSVYGKFQEAVNGTDTDTVPLEVYDEATAKNASLKAKVAELTKQLQKNEADLQRSLDEKKLRVDELTDRLMITQQECEKQMWDNNKSTKEVAVLKTGRDTLVMDGIDRELKLAQLTADNGHLQSDLTSANSRTAAEKEERRKSSEGHLKTESSLEDENTTLKQKLSAQSEDRRNSSEGHRKAESQLQEKVTMLQQQVTDYEALLKSAESGVGDDEKAGK
mmetsp:Transcript_2036/g.2283  ORF Transcript_2036/g.2283 Transcript_2036/m.2283 type:complete len:516 (+) Transcript_2036:225-1772(+)